jgi:hypothetical protein
VRNLHSSSMSPKTTLLYIAFHIFHIHFFTLKTKSCALIVAQCMWTIYVHLTKWNIAHSITNGWLVTHPFIMHHISEINNVMECKKIMDLIYAWTLDHKTSSYRCHLHKSLNSAQKITYENLSTLGKFIKGLSTLLFSC